MNAQPAEVYDPSYTHTEIMFNEGRRDCARWLVHFLSTVESEDTTEYRVDE